MSRFTGYYRGWDRCECGATLVKVGDRLRHRAGVAKIHAVVMKIKGGMPPRQAFQEAK